MATTQTTPPKTTEHPEVLVGAAFLGGLVLAQVLKKLGGDR
jgi:hypothetical protein